MELHCTLSQMTVRDGDRVIKIFGEMLLGGEFYTFLTQIRHWEPPYQDEPMTESERERIAYGTIAEGAKKGLRIVYLDLPGAANETR